MKRAFNVLLIIGLLSSAVLASMPVIAQETPTDIWEGPIQTEVVRDLSATEVKNRPDCVYQNARKKNLTQPFEFLFGSIPILKNLVYEDLGQQCIVQNNQGLFTSTLVKSLHYSATSSNYYGDNANGLFGFNIGNYNHLDPAPDGDVVIFQGRPTYFDQTYYAVILKKISSGNPGISGGNLVWSFSEPDAEKLKYANGTEIRLSSHAFSANGRYLVFQTNSNTNLVNLETMTLTPVMVDSQTSNGLLAVSNDGKHVAVLRNGLHIINTENCELTFPRGEWSTPTSPALAGCNRIRNRLSEINSAVVSSNYYLRPYFSPNGSKLILSAGTRIPGISPNATGPTAYTWQELEISATNYLSSAEGYLALGDSYSSGEGDTEGGTWYESGTDEQGDSDTFNGRNLCHLSRRSYPYLMAMELGYLASNSDSPPADGLFHSVACSGAKIHNITGILGEKQDDGGAIDFSITDNQYRYDTDFSLSSWQPGATKQINFLTNSLLPDGSSRYIVNPEAITISIGGNDAGFGQKLASCLAPGTCEYATSEDKRSDVIIELASEKQNLVRAYKKLKDSAPDTNIYAVGYPQFVQAGGGTCGNNVHLDQEERYFINNATQYFNFVIESAAVEAGVTFVDVSDILQGTNLCSGITDSDITVNGVTLGNDISLSTVDSGIFKYGFCVIRKCIGSETYHPNSKAQPLYKNRILSATSNLTTVNPGGETSTLPTPSDYYGVRAQAFVNNLNGYIPTEEQVQKIKEIIVGSLGYRQPTVRLDNLLPGSIVSSEIQSDPVSLGAFAADENGHIETNLTIPENIAGGYHEIHLKGTNKFGEPIDYYQPILLEFSIDDFDGDGVVNSIDTCPTVVNSGADIDKDNIDDACDPEAIELVVEPEEPPVVSPITNFFSRLRLLFTKIISYFSLFFRR